jgi:hypothetical protein
LKKCLTNPLVYLDFRDAVSFWWILSNKPAQLKCTFHAYSKVWMYSSDISC